jgi:hypothetical protein
VGPGAFGVETLCKALEHVRRISVLARALSGREGNYVYVGKL